MNPDWIELLSAFSAAEVRFLVVGATALAWHGFPRATGDLDVWVEPTPANAKHVLQALLAFGAPLDGVRADDFSRPGKFLRLGVEPVGIDILTELTALTFAGAWRGRQTGTLAGVMVSFIGKEDLIANKRAVGRPQDMVDVHRLENG